MDFRFVAGEPAGLTAALLVVPLFENELSEKKPPELLSTLDGALDGLLLQAATEEGFKGRADQSFTFHTHAKLGAGRVMLVGLGQREKFTQEKLRLACGRAVKNAARLKAKEVAVVVPGTRDPEWAVRAVVEGFLLGGYKFDRYRTRGKDESAAVKKVSLVVADAKDKALQRALDLAVSVATAANFSRDLVNEPAMVVTPKRLAEEARALGEETGLKVTVLGRKEIEKLKMGMFLGVAQGSVLEPQLIHLQYVPKSAKDRKKAPVVFVGKAITFDSGGLSLKTADGMVDMKTDMAGSAAVLGAMRVIAEELAPPFPVHALMGACENMPSGTAYRPGDILISRKGKTVEITNTDAEGRLVLGDVLTYATELEPKPAAIVDLATLTGACMVALGHYVVGAFGEDDALMYEVLEAGRAAGEELWRLPIHELQKDALRSEVADMKNSGERYGGAINAAHFLKEFVGDVPWVHLDIAGPSQSPKERGYFSKGATGVGVRTLVEWVRRRAAAPQA